LRPLLGRRLREANSRPEQRAGCSMVTLSRSFLQHGGSVAATDELVLELWLIDDVPLEVELEGPLGTELEEPLGIGRVSQFGSAPKFSACSERTSESKRY